MTKLAWGSAPNIFDIFTPEKGVIFYEGARQKKGMPAYMSHSISLADGSLVSQNGGPVKLTKSEYLHLTKAGNLSRSISEVSNQDNGSGKNGKWQIKVDGVKDLDFEKTKMLKRAGENKSSLIKSINYSSLETLLANDMDNFAESYKSLPAELKSPKFTIEKGIMKSPVDTFNIEILNSKDWGKNIGSGVNHNLALIPKNMKKHSQLKNILGPLPKLPRDRTMNMNTASQPYLKSPIKH